MVFLLLSWMVIFALSLQVSFTTRGHDDGSSSSLKTSNRDIGTTTNSPCWSVCSSTVGSQRNMEECIRDCELTERSTEKNSDKSNMMTRRLLSVNVPEKECLGLPASGLYPCIIEHDKVVVNFTKESDKAIVSWEPLKNDYICKNWISYALIYQKHNDYGIMKCAAVPKNQTHWTISGYWKYPETLSLAVVTFPYSIKEGILLSEYVPRSQAGQALSTFDPHLSKTVTPEVIASIAGGVTVGVVLFTVVLVAIMCRKRKSRLSRQQELGEIVSASIPPSTSRSERGRDERVSASISPPTSEGDERVSTSIPLSTSGKDRDTYYSCYYPENEAYRHNVAAIVNTFRENGYDVMMDVMASREISSQGPGRWAEHQIRRAKNVLVFLSPGLVKLTLNDTEGIYSQDITRVWIELELLRELHARARSAARMVCIVLHDFPINLHDLPLWAKVCYKWPEDFDEILKRMNNRPSVLSL